MQSVSQFQAIRENDPFLSLFSHRLDYIYANHAAPGRKPQWHTESRHALSDRHILEGKYLYGVAFGADTNYFMLDIDRQSLYHPKRDRWAIGRILDALEPLGVTDFIPVTSSYSEGVHLYFPLSIPLPSRQVAAVVDQLLKFKGLVIEDGVLELFPSVRLYDAELGHYSKSKAHRLPLQTGSYLLTEDWQLTRTTPDRFCKLWEFCSRRNEVNQGCFEKTLKLVTRNYHRLGFKGEKFLRDLNTEIEPGWSGHGQTNYLLGRITLRAYVFGHRLTGDNEPLTGQRLVNEIVRVATQSPGYQEFCRHKHEIYQRAEEWARCAENSRYYPYGHSSHSKKPASEPTYTRWNEHLRKWGIERLCFAIADLLNQERFPAGIKERFDIFVSEYGFSGETLYKDEYLELWHPSFIGGILPVENPPDPPSSFEGSCEGLALTAPLTKTPISLLPKTDRKGISDKGSTWFKGWEFDTTGCNVPSSEGFSHLDTDSGGDDG